MRQTKVIAVFDIGKTNKKALLFDDKLRLVYENEERFQTATDEDGFECDDIDLIENWMHRTLGNIISNEKYEILAVNFSTYGASLAFLNAQGQRLTPVYNYLKEIPHEIQEDLFRKYGGQAEFCRQTASPALGLLLNSGVQILWIKKQHPELFNKVKSILHFPQYLSYLHTGKRVSEFTSIGCHTFLWDYDRQEYHQWLNDEEIILPQPLSNSHTFPVKVGNKEINFGIGIHDSSASLAPYIIASSDKFVLLSTGTWCINMNPYNHNPLTADQLQSDCLAYLSVVQKPVKSSRLFMGHIHDENMRMISRYFSVSEDSYKSVQTDASLLRTYLSESDKSNVFFKNGVPENYVDENIDLSAFADLSEAYHRFMYDLTKLNKEAIDMILEPNEGVKNIYISGGFARNEIFIRLTASFYPGKRVFTSELDNSSGHGAAMVVYKKDFKAEMPEIDLGLKEWKKI